MKPTVIMRTVRLDYREFTDFTDLLLKRGLLEIIPVFVGKTKVMYKTTMDGEEFINHAKTCFAWIEDDYIKNIERKIKRAV